MADVNETTHSTTGKDLDTKFLDGAGLGHVFEILKNEHRKMDDASAEYFHKTEILESWVYGKDLSDNPFSITFEDGSGVDIIEGLLDEKNRQVIG